MAAAGCTAIGIDIAVAALDRARCAAAEANVDARFVTGDLPALPDLRRVDAIVSYGNSFGYLSPAATRDGFDDFTATGTGRALVSVGLTASTPDDLNKGC